MSDSVRPHRRQPTRLLCPWDFPGKNTGVGCHFLLQCMKVKSESEVAQLCPTLLDPMDYSQPGSSIYGILQARVLEWVAIAFSDKWSITFFIFFSGFIHVIILFIKLCGGYSWGLRPLHGDSGVGLHKMVSEFLNGEVCWTQSPSRGCVEIAVGLRDGMESMSGAWKEEDLSTQHIFLIGQWWLHEG